MKKRILCFGDSNTWGYDPANGSRYDDDIRWTGQLQQLLGCGYTVIEEGQNGRTTVWDDPVENRMAGITYLWPCMESHSPFDLLIVMLGTNDTKPYFSCPAQSIADGAGRLVELAQKSTFGPDGNPPKVLLVAPIRIMAGKPFAHIFEEKAVEKAKLFTSVFCSVSERLGCFFLDAAEFAEPAEADGVHLSPKGHKDLAESIYRKTVEIFHVP